MLFINVLISQKRSSSGSPGGSPPAPIVYSGPVTFTTGGTKTGNWESLDSTVPAVTINTTEPINIEGCNIRGAGTLIKSNLTNANISIQNNKGYGLEQSNDTVVRGKFAVIENFKNLVIHNNYLEQTSGIYLRHYTGNGTTDTVKVRYNKAKNIDGRNRLGTAAALKHQFLMLNDVLNVPGIEIAWNLITNERGNSLVEDNINIYMSSGTEASPILIHDNFIDGAYALTSASSYAGGGIIVDGHYEGLDVGAWVKIYNNQVIRFQNYGIAIAGGHDNIIHDNRIVNSNTLGGIDLTIQTVGAYVWNFASAPEIVWFNNRLVDNFIANVTRHEVPAQKGTRFVPDAAEDTNNTNTLTVADITTALENAEYTSWNAKLSTNSISIGPNF